jgi:clan AA aspartic protease
MHVWYERRVGHVYQRVKLAAVNEAELDILVDTGATFSLISPALADRLGVARLPRKQVIALADGRRLEAEIGSMVVQIGDRSAAATVLVVDCDEPLLGVETLEALGLAVDPSTGTLKATRSYTVRLGGVR